MARVKRGTKRRRRNNKILKLSSGFHFDRRRKIRQATHTVERALHYGWKSRKRKKREMRSLWITRLGAACQELGKSYSRFISDLKAKNITLNRKMLAEIAARDFEGFKVIFNAAK